MIKYEVIDNFLSDSDFTELKDNIFPPPGMGGREQHIHNLSWVYDVGLTDDHYEEPPHLKKITDIEPLNPIHEWCFAHLFLAGPYQTQTLSYLSVLLSKINPISMFRIQANFTVQQEKLGRSLFHIDYEGKTTMTTSIFYMNTTNGPTILEDGTEIECRANRLVTYPYNTYHAGVMCTDQPYRIVINLNYFTDDKLEKYG